MAYLIALSWTLPVAFWVGENPRALRIVTPIAEIGASIPATALFPFFIVLAVHVLGGDERRRHSIDLDRDAMVSSL
ncbi:MAG: hypothetical protein MPW15_17235 [Candidatus Manganitrophus sp.]|nr:hypothetical protein [Candidatus Manganitrophus sp.]